VIISYVLKGSGYLQDKEFDELKEKNWLGKINKNVKA